MQAESLSRREKDRIRHRHYILDAALKLFSEKGYHSVSMYEIASKSEFAIGTLYKFFKNKEDLYKCLIMTKVQEYHDTLHTVLSEKKDAISILSDYVSAKFKIFAGDAPAFRLYFIGTKGSYFNIRTGFEREVQTLYNKLLSHIAAVMEKGISSNLLKKINPYCMALTIEEITNTFLYNMLENPGHDFAEADAAVMTEVFLQGVLEK